MRRKALLVIGLLAFASTNSAEIQVEQFANNLHLVTIQGEIRKDDSLLFAKKTLDIQNAFVVLDSAGGSVLDALSIGKLIRNKGFMTGVPDKTICASSCALIWLAGIKRFAEESSFIGFHAAYIYKNGKQYETGAGNALIGSYLRDLGLSDNAIIYVTSAPPEGIERLNKQTGNKFGIKYLSISEIQNINFSENFSNRTDEKRNRRPKFDSIDVVARFYQALSQADGDAASSLVIPEKRGLGPFNEKNIASFFGNMITPLKVHTITQIDQSTIEVKYTYRYSKSICNGNARVKTENFLGNILIKEIKANC